ncbi:site-specific DNA-methyltransferase [Thermoactinomyces sp. CICC 10521]|uniref:DNA-methyltransferase n=2 Tax=unclassified Thermoactinomyces TaxID=2634588 RepID=UPI0018DCF325|nr:site-specific DNA-methyltransferase [Thermoactinomyces sp. CICC 10521]MBH8609353.1 site-specific DNA-methyltransferase [Thermoactinomyces sp. CICC 10521]
MFDSPFFRALDIKNDKELKTFAKLSQVSVKSLKYYAEKNIFPSIEDLRKIMNYTGCSEAELRLKMGVLNQELVKALRKNSSKILELIADEISSVEQEVKSNHELSFTTEYGKMFQGDCLSLMKTMEDESIDLIFADPPFNLDKKYESGINDKVSELEYLEWTEKWVLECVRLLKQGGSLFIWNLPKWNTYISSLLNHYLDFKHWIAVDIKYRLPIKNRLYPAHYSLLYYTKGEKANTFNEQRLPLEVCRHCYGDIHDYGGYKDKLNIKGINLTDIWSDIPPVRHSKYKTRGSNELSLKLLERIISLATNEGDIVFDPFGGSGTTYIAAEILKRRWIGIEIGSTQIIKNRFDDIEWQREYVKQIQENTNTLFTEEMKLKRRQFGHWLPETLKSKGDNSKSKREKVQKEEIQFKLNF